MYSLEYSNLLAKFSAMPSARVAALKKTLLEGGAGLDSERFKFLLDIYREKEGDPPIIVKAKLIERSLTEKTIYEEHQKIPSVLGIPGSRTEPSSASVHSLAGKQSICCWGSPYVGMT